MKITSIELDDDNWEHATARISYQDIEQVLLGNPRVRKNKRLATGDYVASAHGITVVFLMSAPGVARPITGWKD